MSVSPASNSASVPPPPVELLQRLIRFDTTNPPGNERECVAYIKGLLDQAGCDSTIVGRDANRPNLIARLKGQGTSPPLLLFGHIDVVTTANQAWQYPPFQGELVDGYVWGRGALDMKGGIVMMLLAFLRAKAEGVTLPGDVVLAVVSDEEAGGDYGASYLVDQHSELFHGIRYAIGEFGGFSYNIGRRRFYPIMVAEKQVCQLRATVRGTGGHAALAGNGGAMSRLARLLNRLEDCRLPVHVTPVTRQMIRAISSELPPPASWAMRLVLNPGLTNLGLKLMGDKGLQFRPLFHNTVNATIVRGGEKINVTPSEISVDLDARLLPGFCPEDVLAELRGILGKQGEEVELEIVRHDPGAGEPDMGLFDRLAGILRRADPQGTPVPMLLPGATDARYFAKLGIQTYGFTPMRLPPGFNFMQTIHGPDERLPVEALDFGTDAIYQLLRASPSGVS